MTLSGEVECDEVYVVTGHKGHPEIVAQQGRKGRRRRLKGKRGRGTLAGEKPPILGMIQRGGEVVLHILENVQQQTIKRLLPQTIQLGSLVFTDEYDIYARLEPWGYQHLTVTTAKASMPAMMMATASMRSLSIRWKVSGVDPTLLVASSSWYLPRTPTLVFSLLRVCSQCPPSR